MKAKVIDNLPRFSRSMRSVYDDALGETAKDILIGARNVAPFEKGALRRESDVSQASPLKWRVSFWVEYARFQEFGGDSRRRVRNYTTGGTGAGFLKTTGDKMTSRLIHTFKKHSARIR